MTLPGVPEPFYWADSPVGPLLKCRPLDAAAVHGFTTRHPGFTSGDDWQRLAAALGARRVATANQVHGRAVVVPSRGAARLDERPDADALLSDDPAVAVAVRAADCVPLLIADTRRPAVAAVHAGWRGTAAGAAIAAVEALNREFGSRPEDLVVAIGPSIGACCYGVGSELVDAFAAAGHARHLVDRWFLAPPAPRGRFDAGRGAPPPLRLDLPAANRDQLVVAGVPESQVYMSALCTAEHVDVLTSFRVEKERAGRLAGVIRPPAPGSVPRG